MKYLLFYIIPLAVYAIVNNLIADLYWPHFLILLASFILFQLARMRYPKDGVPATAKIAQGAFYILTVAIIFRDQYLEPLYINVFIGITLGLVIIDIVMNKKQASK